MFSESLAVEQQYDAKGCILKSSPNPCPSHGLTFTQVFMRSVAHCKSEMFEMFVKFMPASIALASHYNTEFGNCVASLFVLLY